MSTVRIYLSCVCFYYFSYNYSLKRVCLFVCFSRYPLSSTTMWTHLLLRSLPTRPSLQAQPEHDPTMAMVTGTPQQL